MKFVGDQQGILLLSDSQQEDLQFFLVAEPPITLKQKPFQSLLLMLWQEYLVNEVVLDKAGDHE